MDVLETIVASKRSELAAVMAETPLEAVQAAAAAAPDCRGFRAALEKSDSGIIAEFKRQSPSKGPIFIDADPAVVVPGYQQSGAAACSVLTERAFFKARSRDFATAREAATLPLLRKDFIVDEYQVYETKAMGADAILLIASVLDRDTCAKCAALAKILGLDTILEIRSEPELEYLDGNIDILGINNRHLGSFVTDVENSFKLAAKMREKADKLQRPPLLISESGIRDMATVRKLREAGFRGFLIGETFMRTQRPAESLKEFLQG